MKALSNNISEADEYLGMVSALAMAHNVSECDITEDDIKEFCKQTGWKMPEVSFELCEGTLE